MENVSSIFPAPNVSYFVSTVAGVNYKLETVYKTYTVVVLIF